MQEEHTKDIKNICTACGFDSHIAGYCPQCEEGYMKKVCECDSGQYASTCCEPELVDSEAELERKLNEELSKKAEEEDLAELKKIAEEQASEEE